MLQKPSESGVGTTANQSFMQTKVKGKQKPRTLKRADLRETATDITESRVPKHRGADTEDHVFPEKNWKSNCLKIL